jgi:hypothetical protein
MIGERIAIHAGRRVDQEIVRRLRAKGYELPEEMPRRRIVATARIVEIVRSKVDLDESQREWWIGPFGWRLEDVDVLPEPIWCHGRLGLWAVRDAAAKAIAEHEGA